MPICSNWRTIRNPHPPISWQSSRLNKSCHAVSPAISTACTHSIQSPIGLKEFARLCQATIGPRRKATNTMNISKRSKRLLRSVFHRKADKVFCVSMQRNGTTSVGSFFRDFGYRRAGWPADEKNNWSESWYEGHYERIFSSIDFRAANAFEDSPWWLPGFYKILFHRFPNSKFILFTRDPDLWFESMVKHSGLLGCNR